MGRMNGRVQLPRLLGRGVEEFYPDGTPHTPRPRAKTPESEDPPSPPTTPPPPSSLSLLSADAGPPQPTVSPTVLVLGALSFVGAHAVLALVEAGYNVRVLAEEATLEERERLSRLHPLAPHRLAFFSAHLRHAAAGCPYVVILDGSHGQPRTWRMAGALLTIHRYAAPRRIVIISSAEALLGLRIAESHEYVSDVVQPAVHELSHARRLAVTLGMPIVVLLPSLPVGPLLTSHEPAAAAILRRWWRAPSLKRIWAKEERYAVVDVRDIAIAVTTVLAQTRGRSGEMFLLVAGEVGPEEAHRAMEAAYACTDTTTTPTRSGWRDVCGCAAAALGIPRLRTLGSRWVTMCAEANAPRPLCSDKITATLGVGLRPVDDGLGATARDLRQAMRRPVSPRASEEQARPRRWWLGTVSVAVGALLWHSKRVGQ